MQTLLKTKSIVILVFFTIALLILSGSHHIFRGQAASTTLVISEVLYNPVTEPDGEWIEIYNLNTVSINLTNYKIGDEIFPGGTEGMTMFPDGTIIAPGQVMVIANKASAFFAKYGFYPDFEILDSEAGVSNMMDSSWSTGSIALANAGDEVIILNDSNVQVDALSWGDSTAIFNPSIPIVSDGHSLERYPANLDTDIRDDWRAQPHPDPGNVYADQITVLNQNDSGPGSLRQAILDADSGTTIVFDPTAFPPGSPGVIFLSNALPVLDINNLAIDASNTGVILDGAFAPVGTKGIFISANDCIIQGLTIRNFDSDGISIQSSASGNTIGGSRTTGTGPNGQGNLIISNQASGIEIQGADNLVIGNNIGIDASGNWDSGNAYNGIALWKGASGNTVGGSLPEYRNIISGNDQNGIWIAENGTTQNVVINNYIGTRVDGIGAVPNRFSGIAIHDGAQNNRIGGTTIGDGNLISGNTDSGIQLSDTGTNQNLIFGNLIGTDISGTKAIAQGDYGVMITAGASDNRVGDGSENGRNVISGNSYSGVYIGGANSTENNVEGNYIGTNIAGDAVLPNGLHGVELNDNTYNNLVKGNLLSGNRNHGAVITSNAHDNTLIGNIIGPDATGTYSLGNHPMGGIDIADGAHHNIIGGLGPDEGNIVSGNQTDGIALFTTNSDLTADNHILGNHIGLTQKGDDPLSNGGFGILNGSGAIGTQIVSNTIAYNTSYAVLSASCDGNTISQNSIYSNINAGIKLEENCILPPALIDIKFGSTEIITGTTAPDARVEFFSDDLDQGRIYEGFVMADGSGVFRFEKVGGFTGPNLTATSTDLNGNTSAFSPPKHLTWTVLLYLNGDNDLEEYMFDTLANLVNTGPSQQANILALVDGYTNTEETASTVLYDLTLGTATPISSTVVITGERNLGDGQTLIDFVNWGRTYYPARYTLLSIVDHGGGWAPGTDELFPGALRPIRRVKFLSGVSGLSWDFSADYDYLTNRELRQAFTTITNDGVDPLDVVFYDACLMGLIEVAYQIKDYADFFVSSQNIAWAPVGPGGRYIRTISGIQPDTSPQDMAELLVNTYAQSIPPEMHPYTISAIDMANMDALAGAASDLADALNQSLTDAQQAKILHDVYQQTQKIDYDADLHIEPETDGFVDLYHFAQNISDQYSITEIDAAAQNLIALLDATIIAEEHFSDSPWLFPDRSWNLDDTNGLSIYLPLGEELAYSILITETVSISPSIIITRNLRLRDMYTGSQLQFVADTTWETLISTFYEISPTVTGIVDHETTGLLLVDYTPPQTVITLTGNVTIEETIDIQWASSDIQSGIDNVTIWHQPPHGEWVEVTTVSEPSGTHPFQLRQICLNGFQVLATDKAGNRESINMNTNSLSIRTLPCYENFLPLLPR